MTDSSDLLLQNEIPTSPSVRILEMDAISRLAPVRPAEGHKGTFGRILIWAGSEGMAGAAYLCAASALRSGVGLAHVLVPDALMLPMFLSLPQAILHAIPTEPEPAVTAISGLLSTMDACVIGPGLRPQDKVVTEGLFVAARLAKRLVIDAGALTAVAGARDVFADFFRERISLGLEPAVFTPHPGEFARLIPGWNPQDREEGALAFSKAWGVITVLKGHQTVVCTPDGECYSNPTGNDGLAKGGSGDVLGGMIGSFQAQGLSSRDAALAGVYLHGLAGDIAAQTLGRRYMQPTDLFANFTEAFRRARWEL